MFILSSRKTDLAKSAREEKITRAPCRKRTGDAVLRAEKFGDLMMMTQIRHRCLFRRACTEKNSHLTTRTSQLNW